MQFTQPDPPERAGGQTGPEGPDGLDGPVKPAPAARARWAPRRRGVAAGAVVAGLAGLTAGVLLASSPGQDQPASLAALSGPRSAPAPVPSPVPSSARPAPVPSATGPVPVPSTPPAGSAPVPSPAPSVPEGKVIPAGTTDAAGKLVFYVIKISLSALPRTSFGIMAGHRDAAGHLTGAVETNETAGNGTAAGFHAAEAPMQIGSPPVQIPEFGYYAGPAARITGTVAGHQVQAVTARWNLNPGIVIFWFPDAANPSGATVQHLAAYDQAGHQLPTGHNTAGRG